MYVICLYKLLFYPGCRCAAGNGADRNASGRIDFRLGHIRPIAVTGAGPLATPEGVVVISAAQGGEIASDYERAHHGMFTYFLLRGLRGEADADRDKVVTLLELYDYVAAQVARNSADLFSREQRPVLMPPASALGSEAGLPLAKVARP